MFDASRMNDWRPKLGLNPGAGWLLLVVLVVFTLSIGTAVHNHGIFGADGGAEKISQSKFMCPACVFDGRPITFVTAAIVIGDSSHLAVAPWVEISCEKILGETSSSRAPPIA